MLTFSQALGQADLWSDVPLAETSWGPSVLVLWSGQPLVRCTPKDEVLGQVDNGETLGQADLCFFP